MSPSDPSERVRQDCRRVAESARFVRVAVERIPAYAEALDPENLRLPSLDPDSHHLGRGDETVAFMLTLEAVNFGSANLADLRPGGSADAPPSGYFEVAGALARHFRRHGPLTAEQLVKLTPDHCAEVFGQQDHAPAMALMRRFTASLNGLGEHLSERFGGSFRALVESAEGSAQRLVERMVEIESFRDEAVYDGELVCLYKRAQLTAADLSLAFTGQDVGRLAGLDRLTIFADDLVPHVLRTDGVLLYDEALQLHIDRGDLLEAGSPEEVEIRAGAVHAAKLITEELRRRGPAVCPMQVDYCLWNRGLTPRYRQRPRHRTVTDFY